MFQHTIEIHWHDNPVISTQAMILGSNKIDFMNPHFKEHSIKTLYLEPLEAKDPFELYHNYRRNESSVQFCKGGGGYVEEDLIQQTSSPGILMIFEAEQITADLRTSNFLKEIIVEVLEEEGLEVASAVLSKADAEGNIMVMVLKEGYVVARTFPSHKYVAFDVHLWSSFEKHENIKKALIAALGIRSSSSFRIVAGGMSGVGTWKDYQENRGPVFTQDCDDRDKPPTDNGVTKQVAMDTVLEDIASLVKGGKSLVVVLCGEKSDPCRTVKILENQDNIGSVIPLRCGSVGGGANKYMDPTIACEQAILETLKGATAADLRLSAIFVDSSASVVTAQIMLQIFKSKLNQRKILMKNNVLVVSVNVGEVKRWRGNFVRRFLEDIFYYEPAFNADILFNNSNTNFTVSVTSYGDARFVQNLIAVLRNIEEQNRFLPKIQDLTGGVWVSQPYLEPSQFFLPVDQNQSAPLEQWNSQKPLGFQSIFQLESKEETISMPLIQKALDTTLSNISLSHTTNTDKTAELHVTSHIGDGCLLRSVWAGGNAVVIWDGNLHIDINLFMRDQNSERADAFLMRFIAEMPALSIALHDEQPRGIGRVVNYLSDVHPYSQPHWV